MLYFVAEMHPDVDAFVKCKFLKKVGNSFKERQIPDIRLIKKSDVVTILKNYTERRKIYNFSGINVTISDL